MNRDPGSGGPTWAGASQGALRAPGPQGVGQDPRLSLAFGIADVVAPAPTTYLGGSGVGLRPGMRTPFGPSGSTLAEGDQLYLATGYRRTWGAPPRIEGYQWNPLRAVYEPTMVGGPPVNQGVRALRDQAFALAQQGVFLQALPDESAASGWLYRWVRTFGDFPSTAKPYALYATLEAMQPKQPREAPVDPEIAAAMEGKTGLAAAEARKAMVDARLSHQLREIKVQTPAEREAAFQAERVRQRRAFSSLSGSTEADYSFEAWLRDPTFAGEIPGGAHLGVNYLQPAVDKIKADRKKQGLPDLPPPQFTGFAGIKARRAAKQLKEANEQAQRAEDALYKKYEDRYWDLLDIERDLEAKIQAQDTAANATGGQEGRAPEHQREALERAKDERTRIEAKQWELVDRKQDRRAGASLPSITRPPNIVQVGVMPAGTPMWNSKSFFTRTIKDEPLSAWVTPRPQKKKVKDKDGLVQVPSVTALTDEDAKRALAAVGLRFALAPGSAPAGRVASQEPDWTKRVKPGTAVRVMLKPEKQKMPEPTDEPPAPSAPVPSASKKSEDQPGGFRYAETATVPNVVGLSVGAAQGRLSAEGFAAAVQAGVSNSARVLSQNPAGGTVARKGATVALLAERKQETAELVAMDTVAVPDVYGLPLAEAQRRLAGVHLTGIPTGSHKGHKDAVVATQRPRAGTKVQRGALVELQAWAPSGPEDRTPPREGQTVESPPVAVPDVRGMLPVQAETFLRNQEFAVYFATPRLADWPVTKQAPAPGTRVRRGARVDVWAEPVLVDPGPRPPAQGPTPERRPGEFFIPDVIGMTLAEARAALGPLHRVRVIQEEQRIPFNDSDRIATQDPGGPSWVLAPAVVVLGLADRDRYGFARPTEKRIVPDVVGLEVEAARDTLHDAGFVPAVTHRENPGATIASQDPGGLSERLVGTIVTITPRPPTAEQEEAARARWAQEELARGPRYELGRSGVLFGREQARAREEREEAERLRREAELQRQWERRIAEAAWAGITYIDRAEWPEGVVPTLRELYAAHERRRLEIERRQATIPVDLKRRVLVAAGYRDSFGRPTFGGDEASVNEMWKQFLGAGGLDKVDSPEKAMALLGALNVERINDLLTARKLPVRWDPNNAEEVAMASETMDSMDRNKEDAYRQQETEADIVRFGAAPLKGLTFGLIDLAEVQTNVPLEFVERSRQEAGLLGKLVESGLEVAGSLLPLSTLARPFAAGFQAIGAPSGVAQALAGTSALSIYSGAQAAIAGQPVGKAALEAALMSLVGGTVGARVRALLGSNVPERLRNVVGGALGFAAANAALQGREVTLDDLAKSAVLGALLGLTTPTAKPGAPLPAGGPASVRSAGGTRSILPEPTRTGPSTKADPAAAAPSPATQPGRPSGGLGATPGQTSAPLGTQRPAVRTAAPPGVGGRPSSEMPAPPQPGASPGVPGVGGVPSAPDAGKPAPQKIGQAERVPSAAPQSQPQVAQAGSGTVPRPQGPGSSRTVPTTRPPLPPPPPPSPPPPHVPTSVPIGQTAPSRTGLDFEMWAKSLRTRAKPRRSAKNEYDRRVAGPKEYEVTGLRGRGEQWVDGLDPAARALVDAKYASPRNSPWVDGGGRPPPRIKDFIRKRVEKQMVKYGLLLRSGRIPAVRLIIRTNAEVAKRYFESLMRRHGVPGRVDLVE